MEQKDSMKPLKSSLEDVNLIQPPKTLKTLQTDINCGCRGWVWRQQAISKNSQH